MKPKSTLRHFLAIAGSSLLALSSASALTFYWDNNGTGTTGFGTAGGTWSSTGSTLWSGSATGAADVTLGTSVTTTTTDLLNFGTGTAGNGLAAGTINVSNTVNAGTITFGSQSGSILFSGGTINLAAAATIDTVNSVTTEISSLITGAGTSFTKSGNGALRLSNTANTYTGATIIGSSVSGTLEATFLTNGGLASSIGASSNAASNLVLGSSNAGFLSYVGSTNATTDRLFTLGASTQSRGLSSNGVGTVNFTNTGTVAFSAANAVRALQLGGTNTGQNILSVQLVDNGTGALSVNKSGAGTWVLANNTNSYTGTTTVSAGTLAINSINNAGLASAIGAGSLILGSGGTTGTLLYTGAAAETSRTVQINTSGNNNGGGAIINNGTGALTFTATTFNVAYADTNSLRTRILTLGGTNGGTINGEIVNISATILTGLAKTGSGTWTLGAAHSYTGNTDINGGTLRFQSGASDLTQTRAGLGAQLGDGTFNSNKSDAGNISTTFTSFARAAGATGNLTITGGTNGTNNSVNITGAAGFINAGLFFGGSEFAARNTTDGYVRALNYATTGGDANTVDVNTVTASRHVKLTTTPYSGAGVTLLSLNLQGSGVNWTNTSGTLTTPGIIKSGGGSQSTISGFDVRGGNNTELVVRTDTSSDLLLISSNLTQGGGPLTKSGAGTLTLSGTNTFTGQTHINAGTLSIGANVHLGAQATGATLNLKGGTLQATGTFGLFNGTAGTNNRAVTLLDQSGIEVTGTNTLTIAGVISNNTAVGNVNPGFNKTGTGTLVLSNTNTYTGATNVNAGTLLVNNTTGSGTGSNTVTVGTLGTLGGTGSIAGAVNVTGQLSPGASIETLGTGTLSMANSSTLIHELNSSVADSVASDLLKVTGDLNLTGTVNLTMADLAVTDVAFGVSDIFSLINYTGAWNGGFLTFGGNQLNDEEVFTFGSNTWKISYNDATGGMNFPGEYAGGADSFVNITAMTAIPEPGAALLGSLGLLALLRRRR